MISAERLSEITIACNKAAGCEEAEYYRGLCGELLDELAVQIEQDITHLRRLIEGRGQLNTTDDIVQTGRNTERYLRGLAGVLHNPKRTR